MVKSKSIRSIADSSILAKISALVTVLCVIIILYSFQMLRIGFLDYRQAKELSAIQEIINPFTDALKDFMFERGRMNVVLSNDDPISANNRSFIDERRSSSDRYFEEGLSLLKEKYPGDDLLRKEYDEIKYLRIKMDEEVGKPIWQRDPNARELWFTSCTEFIDFVSLKLKNISVFSHEKRMLANYNVVIIDALHLRSVVGRESSLLTSVVTSGKPISDEDYASLLSMRGQSAQIWLDIENEVEIIESDSLNAAMEVVKDKYYGQFRPKQDSILELLVNDSLYEGADKEIAELSVPALDSIFLLVDEALEEVSIENHKSMTDGYKSLATGVLQLIAGVLIIVLIPGYLKNRFVQPLNNIVGLLEDLGFGKIDIVVPFVNRTDEIGKLANGVEMLQKSFEEEQALKLELLETVTKLEELSVKDSLTGLYNRRYMTERTNELGNRQRRNKSVFSYIMCDIDRFKKINDSYGHDCGDKVLSSVAKLLLSCCREQDILSRWGGEEFLILLPDTDREGARILAERIRNKLEDMDFEYRDVDIKVTMTFGVSEYIESLGIEGSINNADMALLEGKNSGRNRVIVF